MMVAVLGFVELFCQRVLLNIGAASRVRYSFAAVVVAPAPGNSAVVNGHRSRDVESRDLGILSKYADHQLMNSEL